MAIPLSDTEENPIVDVLDAAPLPVFTTAIRGYQKEEVHAFLRELRTEQDENIRERQRLEIENHDLIQRVTALEHSLQHETPHTIEALGERLYLILHHGEAAAREAVAEATEEAERIRREAADRAEEHVRQASLRASQAAQTLHAARTEAQRLQWETEEALAAERATKVAEALRTAAETVSAAEHQAAAQLRDAEARVAEAEAHAAQITEDAQAQADRLVADAHREAGRLVAEAGAEAERLVTEAKAQADAVAADARARLADAEAQAQQLTADAESEAAETRARADADRARAEEQIAERRALASAHLDALGAQRDELLGEMAEIHETLTRTLRATGFLATPAPDAALPVAGGATSADATVLLHSAGASSELATADAGEHPADAGEHPADAGEHPADGEYEDDQPAINPE